MVHPLLASYQGSDFLGKLIFLSLLISSCLSWFFLLTDWIKLKKIQKNSLNIKQSFQKNQNQPLHFECLIQHPFQKIVTLIQQHAIAMLGKNKKVLKEESVYLANSDLEALRHHSFAHIGTVIQNLSKHLFLLATITSLAPFLGLLGTVWGILLTFSQLQSGLHLQAQSTMMGGLAMALGTTVLGLVVAIPALIGHNMIKSEIQKISYEMDEFSEILIHRLELHYKKVER